MDPQIPERLTLELLEDERRYFVQRMMIKQLANEPLSKWPNEAVANLARHCFRIAKIVEEIESELD